MSDHKNHRIRLRERFVKESLENFNDINALELLLFYCIPQKDTNPIAHDLIDHFGNLDNVINAKAHELKEIYGVGDNVVTFLSLLRQLEQYRKVRREDVKNIKIMDTTDSCGAYLMPKFHGMQNESVYLLCLDAKSKMICCRKVGEGSVNSANIPVRRIVEIALDANASSAVLAHNHPSGLAVPSVEDIQTTRRVAEALAMVDVILADHIVVADEDYVSMVKSRYYSPDMVK